MPKDKHRQVPEILQKFLNWLNRVLRFFKKPKPDLSHDPEIKSLQARVDKAIAALEVVVNQQLELYEKITELTERAEALKTAYQEAKSQMPTNIKKLEEIKKKFQKCHADLLAVKDQEQKLNSKMEYLEQELEMLSFKIHARTTAFTMDIVRESAKVGDILARRFRSKPEESDEALLAELEQLVPYDDDAGAAVEPSEDTKILARLEREVESDRKRAEREFKKLEKFYDLPIEKQLEIKKHELEREYRRLPAEAPKADPDTQWMRRMERRIDREDKILEQEMLGKTSGRRIHK